MALPSQAPIISDAVIDPALRKPSENGVNTGPPIFRQPLPPKLNVAVQCDTNGRILGKREELEAVL